MHLTESLKESGFETTVKRVGVSATALSLTPFILPWLYFHGYVVNIMENQCTGGDVLPEITRDNTRHYIKNGIYATLITIAYLLPILILYGILTMSFLAGLGGPNITSSMLWNVAFFGSIILIVAYCIVTWFTLPAGLLIYIQSNTVTNAFSPHKIRSIVFNKSYIVYGIASGLTLLLTLLITRFMSWFIGRFLFIFPQDQLIASGVWAFLTTPAILIAAYLFAAAHTKTNTA